MQIHVVEIVAGLDIGSQSGGAELVGIQIARNLDRGEFKPSIFSMFRYGSKVEKSWISQLRNEGITVEGLIAPSGSLLRDFSIVLRESWNFMSQFRPKIVNSHSERGDFLNLLIHSIHPSHPRAIRTVHINKIWKTRPFLGSLLNNLIIPLTFSAEIAVSESIRQMLESRPIAKRNHNQTVLCYNGIDASWFLKPSRKNEQRPLPNGIPSYRPRIGVIGRLTEQKGHIDLLKSMEFICQKSPVFLLVIGSGPLEEYLMRQVTQMGLQEYVYFLGNRDDVMDIMPHLDLVVLPSLWEGFPTILLEAMSQEIPIIATDLPGTRELIIPGKTGTLVLPRDPVGLTEAIITQLENTTESQAMVRLARQYAARFTIQNTASCHAEVYKMVSD